MWASKKALVPNIAMVASACVAWPFLRMGVSSFKDAESIMEAMQTPPVSWSHPQPCLVLASQPLYDTKTCESRPMITLCRQHWG